MLGSLRTADPILTWYLNACYQVATNMPDGLGKVKFSELGWVWLLISSDGHMRMANTEMYGLPIVNQFQAKDFQMF